MYALRHFLVLLLAGALHLATGAEHLYLGDYCQLPSGRGICKLWNDCYPFQRNMITNFRLAESLCTGVYKRKANVLCCPEVDLLEPHQPVSYSNTFRRAAQKCREYSREVFQNRFDLPLCSSTPPRRSTKIVGGNKAIPKEHPYMAALGYENKDGNVTWGCGGSLISENYVLTAAHCTFDQDHGPVKVVRLGDVNLADSLNLTSVQQFQVAKIIRHPDYNVSRGKYNDIALLKLDGRVIFDAYVRPACLSLKQENQLLGVWVTVAGWGARHVWEQGTDELHKVMIPIAPVTVCQTIFNYLKSSLPNGIHKYSQICAGLKGKDTCKGDSGGPLVTTASVDRCMHEIIGITSFGNIHCGKTLGLYTRVHYYLYWIENIVWPNDLA